MGKIVLDRRGDLRGGAFYRFNVPFDDKTDGLLRAPQSIVVPRTPTQHELSLRGLETWMWMSGLGDVEDRVATRDCPADPAHLTRWFYRVVKGEAFGGSRVSPIIATSIGDCVALSGQLKSRVDALKLRGARIDPIDLRIHVTGKKVGGYWALQFVGKASLRLPRIINAPNKCPYCGQGHVFCEGCGEWVGTCSFCNESGLAVREDKHGGSNDKSIPFEAGLWDLIEGNTWDGSDLIQAHGDRFASKRFIDWLLRIHAAPFYAEPVWFCVDGMSDQQKKWLDELQKPFEV